MVERQLPSLPKAWSQSSSQFDPLGMHEQANLIGSVNG
jgi:hypothetical protein